MPAPVARGLGVISSDTSNAGSTRNCVEPETEPTVAEMVVSPIAMPTAAPLAAFTVTTEVSFELHSAFVVRSALLESLKVPIAVNCRPTPAGTFCLSAVTTIEARPTVNETVATRVLPLVRKAVATPPGKTPTGGISTSWSPAATVTGPVTSVPLTLSRPPLTSMLRPAADSTTETGSVNADPELAFATVKLLRPMTPSPS